MCAHAHVRWYQAVMVAHVSGDTGRLVACRPVAMLRWLSLGTWVILSDPVKNMGLYSHSREGLLYPTPKGTCKLASWPLHDSGAPHGCKSQPEASLVRI